MGRPNLLVIDHERDEYICNSCNGREFRTASGALNHCRTTRVHEDEFCSRCERLFISSQALSDHIDNSCNHNVCDRCDIDALTFSDLQNHKAAVHHECYDCGREFQNHNNLQQVCFPYQVRSPLTVVV